MHVLYKSNSFYNTEGKGSSPVLVTTKLSASSSSLESSSLGRPSLELAPPPALLTGAAGAEGGGSCKIITGRLGAAGL